MKVRGEVVVEMSADQVRLSMVRAGQVGEARVIDVQARAGETFAASLGALREPLAQLVADAGATGMLARVIFTSAEAGVGVFSCPKKAGHSAALRAASLALGDSASLDVTASPHAMVTVMTDAAVGEHAPQVHTLGVCVSDVEIGAIREVVDSAGLLFGGATPSGAIGMLSAVRLAHEAAGKGVAIVLHVGQHETTIVGEASGRLCFVRQAPIGLETLVDALVREPIADATGATHTLDRNAARTIIARHGIPVARQAVEIGPGVLSTAVLPVLQSTMQRLVVETKQSSRFGLTEAERARAVLWLAGVGSAVPRLGAVVAELTGLALASEGNAISTVGRTIDSKAWIGEPDLLLIQVGASRSRSVNVLRRNLVAGAAVAGLVMGVSWAKTRYDLYRAETGIARLTQPLEADEESKLLAEQVRVANVFLTSTRAAIQAGSPTRVRAEALLLALGEAAPATLRLTSLDLDASDGNGVARVDGKVFSVAGEDPTSEIGRFIDGVAKSAAVKSCKLASTRRGTGEDERVLFFEMNIELVRLPGSSLAAFDGATEDSR